MTYHILNGDAILNSFRESGLQGEVIICRECLVEGPLTGNTINEFFKTRSDFITDVYPANIDDAAKNYYNYVKAEFDKISNIPAGSDIILWFEHDLFCQANMWFIISLLFPVPDGFNIYRALPVQNKLADTWRSLGGLTGEDLIFSFNNKVKLNRDDIDLGNNLWQAYKNNGRKELENLSYKISESFPFLKEVVKAHIERFEQVNRPQNTLKEIIKNGGKDFYSVYAEFSKKEGIYGFGDAQLKRGYDEIVKEL